MAMKWFLTEKIMNKGGGSGPTAAAAAAAAQKQKSLMQRVETDIANIVDNFSQLVNVARVNELPVRNSQEAFTMEMRASRMDLRLLLTMSNKKQLILTDMQEKTDRVLARIGEEAAASLKELEALYYSSERRS
ncbi:hypothetical protein Patl1_29115 [Pistacia atlantica]|uniref:Uncharacterized protein n=1 Tax=Pistacia atlantica TaxID=434234 RepID=A0ACC1BEX2_9ROSI|nr:hypothetical protein Patl1_29115 [Pistacia atlantica]